MVSVFEICFKQSLKCYVHEKNTLFVLCVKKINFGAKIDVVRDIFVFLHKTQKCQFSEKFGACMSRCLC
jgi:hypothetical protein